MKSPKNFPAFDSWDDLIQSELQEEFLDVKAPCVWRNIKQDISHIKRNRQSRWAISTESVIPLSVRADRSYILFLGPVFQHIQ